MFNGCVIYFIDKKKNLLNVNSHPRNVNVKFSVISVFIVYISI